MKRPAIEFPFYFIILLTLIGCSQDEDNGFGNDPFFKDALIDADINKLYGTWAIYEAEYQGQVIPIPANHPSCGPDFSMFRTDNTFSDYSIQSNDCEYTEFRGTWSLEKGILTESISSGQSLEIVIIKLTQNQLSMRVRIDVTGDGQTEIVVANARKHTPRESNFYDYSFFSGGSNQEGPIELTWGTYNGIYEFDKYEIYRSSTDCTKSSMTLIASINEAQQTSFTDDSPPALETVCYYLKIYSVNGLIGESFVQSVYTGDIRPNNVQLNLPSVIDQTIELNWEKYNGHYFDHYEITVQNYYDGTGYAYEEEIIAIIEDKNTTNWVDENPPYFKNPVYSIRAVNIFGNKSWIFNQQIISSRETEFKRPEIIELNEVHSVANSKQEKVIYLLGRNGPYSDTKIYRYNYDTSQIEAESNTSLNSSATKEIKFYENTGSKEVLVQTGIGEIEIFDGNTLDSKFTAALPGVFPLYDFDFLRDNLYLFCDDDNLYVFSRSGSSFSLVDQMAHFDNPENGVEFKLLALGQNQAIVGYYQNSTSIVFNIDSDGIITNKQTVNVPIKINNRTNTVYNDVSNQIINFENKQVYSANSFSISDSFSQPYFPYNIDNAGTQVFGSNNNPEWSINANSAHEKKALIFDLSDNVPTEHMTIGYPLFMFENHLGEIFSISAGTKRESLFRASPKQNLFLEEISN